MYKKLQTPQKQTSDVKTLRDRVKGDGAYFDRIYKTHSKQFSESTKREAYVEAWLLEWSFVEHILLPSLIRKISHKIGLKELPNLEGKFVSHVIDHYYFLSHDVILYKKLREGNNERSKIVHGIKTEEDISTINKKCAEATAYILENISVPILERLSGNITVPVLTLYTKGWKDSKNETLKRLYSAKNYLEKMV